MDVARHGAPVRTVRRIRGQLLAIALLGCASTPAPPSPPAPAPARVSQSTPPREPDAPSSAAGSGGPAAASPAPASADADLFAGLRLLVPVAGVAPDRIPDSFSAPRGSRTHGALDILAPRGTPVVSADDGVVLRASANRAGGLTIYVADSLRRVVYYYAHLDRYAPSVTTGRRVVRGDTIGFVGTTGNAPANVPHLHFQMMRMHPAGRYWEGEPVNPLPYLAADTLPHHEPDE